MAGIISGKEISVPNEIKNILSPNENVLFAFQEAGIGGKVTGLESIFITDRRVIQFKPKTFGLRANIYDYFYTDISNVKLDKGILRSSIFIQTRFQTPNVRIENIPKNGANRILQTIQDGVAGRLVSNVEPVSDIPSSSSHADIAEQIRQLAKLRDANIITEEDFQLKKTELLKRM